MQTNQLRKQYIGYLAEFDEKEKSGKIIQRDGAFYEKSDIDSEGETRVINLTYAEWLLEQILIKQIEMKR
ncbi:MAG: hypothetical protein KKA10_11610 [Euryarchaeota archaeon]|nr:hypothetical protein [Euryarchaeota archaeon]MCG2736609.1 hypothetical protein [Candidatus Methanoperedenaceae archaeon]